MERPMARPRTAAWVRPVAVFGMAGNAAGFGVVDGLAVWEEEVDGAMVIVERKMVGELEEDETEGIVLLAEVVVSNEGWAVVVDVDTACVIVTIRVEAAAAAMEA